MLLGCTAQEEEEEATRGPAVAMVAARTQIHTRWQIPTHHRQWRRRWGVGWELLRCAMSLLAQGEAAVETIDEAVVVAMDAAAAVATIDEEAQK